MLRSPVRPSVLRRVTVACLVVAGLAISLAAGPPAEANTVMVRPTDVQIVRDGDVVTITGRVHVRNWGFSPLTGLAIIGADDGPLKGQVVYVGAVPPETEVDSDGGYSFSVDVSAMPGHNHVVMVTIQFSLDGEQHEVPGMLTYNIPK